MDYLDCFGQKGEECSAITKKNCEGCSFYKPKDQYKSELLKYNGTTDIEKVISDYRVKNA